MSKLLNFSYTTFLPADGKYGSLKDDGSWSGMVGLLETERVDLGMTVADCTRK